MHIKRIKILFCQARSLFNDMMKIDFRRLIASEKWRKLNSTNKEYIIEIDDLNNFI